MKPSVNIEAFIADQRAVLQRLEAFACTPDYAALVTALQELGGDDVEPWLARWLIETTPELSGRPVDRRCDYEGA